jgi:hypothetical protein
VVHKRTLAEDLEDVDREAVARVIRELVEFDVPCIVEFEGELLVQRTDINLDFLFE